MAFLPFAFNLLSNGTPSAQPPHQPKVLGGERGRFGGGKGDLSPERSPFPLQFFPPSLTRFLPPPLGTLDQYVDITARGNVEE